MTTAPFLDLEKGNFHNIKVVQIKYIDQEGKQTKRVTEPNKNGKYKDTLKGFLG